MSYLRPSPSYPRKQPIVHDIFRDFTSTSGSRKKRIGYKEGEKEISERVSLCRMPLAEWSIWAPGRCFRAFASTEEEFDGLRNPCGST